MTRTILLKRVDGFEIWTTVSGAVQHFAVKTSAGRARVMHSLEDAEAFLASRLAALRLIRVN
jgi:hypothetical protein